MKIKLCWFNQHWNVYLYSDDSLWIGNRTEKIIRDETPGHEGEYRLREYKHAEIPIFTFGFFADDAKQRPGHGGEWSSNSPVINRVFGTTLREIAVDQMSVAVPIEWLKELLGDNVEWGASMWSPNYLEIKSAKDYPNPEYDQWIEIIPKLVS